jgi:hypothetical protein
MKSLKKNNENSDKELKLEIVISEADSEMIVRLKEIIATQKLLK